MLLVNVTHYIIFLGLLLYYIFPPTDSHYTFTIRSKSKVPELVGT